MTSAICIPLKRHRGPGVWLLAIAVAAVCLSACGSSSSSSNTAVSSSSSSCKGTPVKLVTISNLSTPALQPTPELAAGATAAADAVTKSCEIGHPVQVVSCDDKFSPNAAAACGREAVSDKALAVVTYSGLGDSFIPIVTKAGIPSVGNNATSSSENTSPLSFPVEFPISALIGEITAAVSLGAHHIALPALDIPSVNFFIAIAGAQAKQLGATLSVIHVSPTATDLTSVAAQIISEKADAVVPIVGNSQGAPLIKALVAQGADLKNKVKLIGDLTTFTPKFAAQLGSQAQGLYASGTAWSPTNTSNPAIAQYLSELKAANQPASAQDVSTVGLQGWAAVHMIADALKGHSVSSRELVSRLSTPGAVDSTKYGLPPINYTKPALPVPQLAKLRLFANEISIWEFNSSGTPQPLAKGFLPVTMKMAIKPLG